MFHFLQTISEKPNLEMNLKIALLNQSSMLKSIQNMFLHPIDVIRDDICGTINKFQPGTNFRSKCFTFYRQFQKNQIWK